MTRLLKFSPNPASDWYPHVTVAALVERDGRFLMIEESCNGKVVVNQPAGHLEEGESLEEALIRETLEETAWSVRPEAITGLYQWRNPGNGKTYLRVCYAARCVEQHDRALDKDILRAMWLSREEILRRRQQLRSPMVLQCLDDYLAGRRIPLAFVQHLT
ncbi:MAG TPA: NUDIX hydrolase [Gammaproteobacteria bacterium]|nr:NUDIX hydrolase [Gammaproteobacteria bacterium]